MVRVKKGEERATRRMSEENEQTNESDGKCQADAVIETTSHTFAVFRYRFTRS